MLKVLDAWNYAAAAHLLNRAGFGGTPKEIEKLEALGLEKAVSHLLDYESIPDPACDPDWAKPDLLRKEKLKALRDASPEDRRKLVQEEQRAQREHLVELRSWWLQRMAKGPRPLQEKLVLFWHGHFATSAVKVRDSYLMWRQNELFRRLATGSWLQLLTEAGKDPAMLIWLDQAQSRKEHPNENFAREVMELFTLGEGHYTEKDIAEGARALTGWSYDRGTQKFVYRPGLHDQGEKVIFGRRGNFGGDDFMELIVGHPQAAPFITLKLWKYFAGTDAPTEVASSLSTTFRHSGNNFKPVLREMFLSEAFYAPSVVRNQVKSPVQWFVGSVRLLERELPPPTVSMGLIRNLGQDLFAPPNVKGWDGGLSWITTNNLLARYNESAMLVQGDTSMINRAMLAKRPGKVKGPEVSPPSRQLRVESADVGRLFTEHERGDKDALVAALQKRYLQARLSAKHERALREFLDCQSQLGEIEILNAIRLVMSTPDYQLC